MVPTSSNYKIWSMQWPLDVKFVTHILLFSQTYWMFNLVLNKEKMVSNSSNYNTWCIYWPVDANIIIKFQHLTRLLLLLLLLI